MFRQVVGSVNLHGVDNHFKLISCARVPRLDLRTWGTRLSS